MNENGLSFETVLSWFGKFTPQLKNYLRVFQRTNSAEQFASLGKDVFSLYREIGFRLWRQPAGAPRAAMVHAMIDDELNVLDLSNSSCREGCNACCFSEKHVTSDEADLLAKHVDENASSLAAKFKEQAEKKKASGRWSALSVDDRRCPLLSDEGSCSAYAIRPAVCRKHFVSSSAEVCHTMKGDVRVELLLVPEIIASAALSLPDQEVGSMSTMVAKRLSQRGEALVLSEVQSPPSISV